ncbi:MAG: nucleotidyltransferase domain-containing protein [Planctomycetota bacterium]
MVTAVVAAVKPERIILFGSQARADQGSGSDVDLLVVLAEGFHEGRSRRWELQRVRRALSGFRVPKDVLVYSSDEVARWADSLNHVIARAVREGRVLYERG